MLNNILDDNSYNQYNMKCNSCNVQNCICNQTTICNTCNIQNCICNQIPICNICNSNICCCDKSISYIDIYTSWEYIIVIGILLLIYIPFFISYFFGINSTWYENLKKDTSNTWIIAGLWIVVTIISYIGLYILWRNPTPETVSRNLTIAVLFFLGNVIFLAWAVFFYQFQNISTATWISLILLLFEFYIFLYVWNIDRLAGLFLIPLVGMYLYFFYSMVHLAFLNGIIL
jgi:tryptophan-rich sensory protein